MMRIDDEDLLKVLEERRHYRAQVNDLQKRNTELVEEARRLKVALLDATSTAAKK